MSTVEDLVWTITKPPASLKYYVQVIPAGTVFFRIHPEKYRALEFNPGFGNARFSPIRDASGKQIPTIYAASSIKGAMMETIFHDIPFGAGLKSFDINNINGRVISRVRTSVDLKVVKLSAPASRKLGISDAELIHSTADKYPQTRRWAEAIHKAAPEVHGLSWISRQEAGSQALVLCDESLADNLCRETETATGVNENRASETAGAMGR